jgi:hypothetical protein
MSRILNPNNKIHRFRAAHGLTVPECAKLFGVGVDYIKSMQSGRLKISQPIAKRIKELNLVNDLPR